MSEKICKELTLSSLKDLLPEEKDRKLKLNENYFLDLSKQYPQLQTSDFISFIHQCLLTGADPRKKQIYLIPREQSFKSANGQWEKKTVATTVVAYQYFISKAIQTGQLKSFKVSTDTIEYINPCTGKKISTICSVASVLRNGMDLPVEYSARYPEFVSVDREGNPTALWKSKPYLMLEKCALCNAMRQTFPEELTGFYTSEEISGIESPNVIETTAIPIEQKKEDQQPVVKDKPTVIETAMKTNGKKSPKKPKEEPVKKEEPIKADNGQELYETSIALIKSMTDDYKDKEKVDNILEFIGMKSSKEMLEADFETKKVILARLLEKQRIEKDKNDIPW